ncbi:MAG: glycosyltransferase family 2 protein, partial [Micromonosporaceae bacterium]
MSGSERSEPRTANQARPASLWVVVPAYNEAGRIGQTLHSLAAQADRDFTLLVVDNGSADSTVDAVRGFAATAPFPVQVLVEPEKGVGCAVDTGFRHAIAGGARFVARTDADCLPHPGWIAAARAELRRGAGMVCGQLRARRDENGYAGRTAFRVMVGLASAFGRLRPTNRAGGYLAPYRMHAGNNMAITAELYLACGGMPRRSSPTDRTFLNRVRRHTVAIARSRAMVVENSTRRL